MPYLGDYLGHLLSEITTARVQADLEAMRVAEMYASHPLLRSMPIPRFRLPNVTLDVPVAIDQLEPANPVGTGGQTVSAAIREEVAGLLTHSLEIAGIELTTAERAVVDRAVDQRAQEQLGSDLQSVSMTYVADQLVAATVAA